MICAVCNKQTFEGVASSVVGAPRTFSGNESLSSAEVTVEIILTCRTCGNKTDGTTTSTIVCKIDTSKMPYPLSMYEFVMQSYGDGWNERANGQRLSKTQAENPSAAAGWADAQAHSIKRKGKAPPRGWGHARSREYLKTETACHHLKMISLSALSG